MMRSARCRNDRGRDLERDPKALPKVQVVPSGSLEIAGLQQPGL